MANVIERSDIINGQWKIQGVIRGKVIRFATELKEGPHGEQYLGITVRHAGATSDGIHTYGIAFLFESNGSKKAFDSYINSIADQLHRRFPDAGISWDITSSCAMIK